MKLVDLGRRGRGAVPRRAFHILTRRLATLVAVLLAFLSCAAPADAPSRLDAPYRVLLLGDSISMGYTAHVQEILEGEAIVFRARNANGRNENCQGTNHGVKSLDRWLALEGGDWDVIHFNFGLHDLKRVDPETGKNSKDPEHPHQADPERYRRQLAEITDRLRATGARLVFATTTPVPPEAGGPHRSPNDPIVYNAIAREVMAARGVAVNELFAFADERLATIQNERDVHFSKEGSRVLGEEVARAIRAAAGRGGARAGL